MNNMKNKILRGANSLLAVLFLFTFVATPYFTFAATKGGAKPGDTFYALDIFFEKADLAFTFNKEKRVQKIIANSEERLAEADDAAVEGKPDVMEKAMSGYQEGISLAIDEAKKINDKEKTKELLSGIGDSVSKHKDVLTAVYDSAPKESKESAEKAIAINTLEQEKVAEEIIAVQSDVAPTQTEEVIEKSQKEQEKNPTAQKQDKDVIIGNKTMIIVSDSASKQTQPNLEANKENITPKLTSSASSKTAGGGWNIGVVTSRARPVIPATPAIPATPPTNNTPVIPAIPATPASPNQSSSSVSFSSSSFSASFSSSVSSSVGTSSSSSSIATSTPPVTNDNFGPWITNLSITPTDINPGGLVTFTVSAEDPNGIGSIVVDIKYPPCSCHDSDYYLRPNFNFSGANSGTQTFTETIDHGTSPTILGDYIITTIRAVDSHGNLSTYYPNGTVSNAKQETHTLTIPVIKVSEPIMSSSSSQSSSISSSASSSSSSSSIVSSSSSSSVSSSQSSSAVSTPQFILKWGTLGAGDGQ